MAPKSRPSCAVCEAPTTHRCLRCRSSYYCSKEHLEMDWSNHQRFCRKSPSERAHEPRRNPNHLKVNAILFSALEFKPRLVRVEYDEMTQNGMVYHVPKPDHYIGQSWKGRSWIESDGSRGPPLRGNLSIEVIYCRTFPFDGSLPNQTIDTLTGGKNAHRWYGNVLALKHTPDRHKIVDISLKEDLPALVKFFVGQGSGLVA
ncbi:hypothetical protein BD410DRAFT_797083 [Rickenella mellea]|uniref:MYND-type domain-containing protein n=1 Tax=Rickenella mellea TaxID=50990 RepID=A0A4Y7PHT4_9AGAM|nr:hypothetical protein BD410DRAFT_797083 [Rickenella mellea]